MAIQDDGDMIGTGVEPVEPDEVDTLRTRVAELERERDQLALSLSATRAERDHAARSAELLESEYRTCYAAMEDYKHAWLEGRAIMAVSMYFGRMRGPDEWCCVSKDGFTKRRVGTRQLAEMHSREGWTITPLYAGSAPVPAAAANSCVLVPTQATMDMQDTMRDALVDQGWCHDSASEVDFADIWTAGIEEYLEQQAMLAAKAKGE